MIGRLRGNLIEVSGNHVVVDCRGVGYEAAVSAYTLAALPVPAEDAHVDLRVYTHVTDRDLTLFAFFTRAERELFDLLITVKKVGPSSAIGILSGGATPTELAQLIAGEHTPALKKLKGVGQKTAEMMVVELAEKCELLLATWGATGAVAAAPAPAKSNGARSPVLDDVAGALLQLGWRKAEVDKALDELTVSGDEDLETLLRLALRSMPR